MPMAYAGKPLASQACSALKRYVASRDAISTQDTPPLVGTFARLTCRYVVRLEVTTFDVTRILHPRRLHRGQMSYLSDFDKLTGDQGTKWSFSLLLIAWMSFRMENTYDGVEFMENLASVVSPGTSSYVYARADKSVEPRGMRT